MHNNGFYSTLSQKRLILCRKLFKCYFRPKNVEKVFFWFFEKHNRLKNCQNVEILEKMFVYKDLYGFWNSMMFAENCQNLEISDKRNSLCAKVKNYLLNNMLLTGNDLNYVI